MDQLQRLKEPNFRNLRISIFLILLVLNPAIWVYSCKSSDPTGAIKAQKLFEKKQPGAWLRVEGKVIKILEDDLKGSRHQRFIIETEKGQTLLITHNIDLAPRVILQTGTRILISGEYLWNVKGGKIHYTHRSTSKRKRSGFIKNMDTGKKYQ